MTPAQFKAWRLHLKLKQVEAAKALGISIGSVRLYEAGWRRDNPPKPVIIPKTVELACAAVALGTKSYSGPDP